MVPQLHAGTNLPIPFTQNKPNSMENQAEEIEETTMTSLSITNDKSASLLLTKPKARLVRTKVPEIEVHLYCQGVDPIHVFKSSLGGWDKDQLEVRDILDKYGLKSIYAYNTTSGRGVSIWFNPKNGQSMLPYKDGYVIHVDREPKVLRAYWCGG